MDERKFFLEKYNIDPNSIMPVMIPNVGRNELIDLFRELGYTRGAEIGVDEGRFSLKLLNKIPNLGLYCIDAWRNYDGYHDRLNDWDLPAKFEITKEKLKDKNAMLIRRFSSEAVEFFDDESLDFVYIDGNHDFGYAFEDIYMWEKKVRKGGIVSGHDYTGYSKHRPTRIKVKKALAIYTELKPIREWYVFGREKKIEGEIRDSSRSWMWIK